MGGPWSKSGPTFCGTQKRTSLLVNGECCGALRWARGGGRGRAERGQVRVAAGARCRSGERSSGGKHMEGRQWGGPWKVDV